MRSNNLKIIFSFIILILFNINCNTSEPVENKSLTLSLEDVSCTEAWLKLRLENTSLPQIVSLYIDDLFKDNYVVSTEDTMIYVDSLLPNKSYKIQSVIHSVEQSDVKSNNINTTTLDTSSHNFSWQSWTFGENSSSTLYYCAIISEDNIWCVGEIYMNDSLGQPDPLPYNLIKWNGQEWELKRISVTYNGNLITSLLFGIYAFGLNDIWLSSGIPIYGDGAKWTQYHLFDMGILNNEDGYLTKIWGSSESNLYYVGTHGTIAHYQSGSWTKMESGTDFNINDIWGDYNEKLNQYEILAVGGNILQNRERTILKISNNNQVQQITTEGTASYPLSSVWFKSKLKYYVGGDGIFTTTSLDKAWQELNLPKYFVYTIRGTELNDIVVCGGAGYLGHFNGYTWKNYLGNGLEEISGNYISTAIKGNTIVAVGYLANGKAIAVIGKR